MQNEFYFLENRLIILHRIHFNSFWQKTHDIEKRFFTNTYDFQQEMIYEKSIILYRID